MPHNVHGVLQVYFAKLNPWLKEKISSFPENFQSKPFQLYAATKSPLFQLLLTVKTKGNTNLNISASNIKYKRKYNIKYKRKYNI